MARNRVGAAPVNDVPSLLEHPHIVARESLLRAHDPVLGEVNLVAPSPRLSATPGQVRFTGPAVGAHNDEVFGELLGFEPQAVATLRTEGVI